MKWKTVLVTAVIVLLVVGLVLLSVKALESQSGRDIKSRIKQYELVKVEQQLITDILTLKYEAAAIRSKFEPAPPPTRTIIESEK